MDNKIRPSVFQYFSRDLGHVPPTPLTGLPSAAEDHIMANSKIKNEVSNRGLQILTTAEKEGREVHDVIPITGKEKDYSNEGSDYFPFHVEVPQAPLDERPDYVMLTCLRGNPEAKTYVIVVDKLLLLLTEADRAVLSKPIFVGKCGVSHGNGQETYLTKVLHENGDMTLHLGNMAGSDDESIAVINKIQHVIKDNFKTLVHVFTLKEGDFLLFDNKKCLHGRSSFFNTTSFDGTHRWLKRVYLRDLNSPDKAKDRNRYGS